MLTTPTRSSGHPAIPSRLPTIAGINGAFRHADLMGNFSMLPLSCAFVSLVIFIQVCLACIGGGGGGSQCCPARAQPSCGASAPSCGASYGGGAYAAPHGVAYDAGSSPPLPPPSSCCGASDVVPNLPPIVQPPFLGHNPGANLPPAPAPPAPSYVQQQVLPALARPPGSSESSDEFHANYAQPQPFPREYQVDHGADQLFPPMAYQEGGSANNQQPAALHMPHSPQPYVVAGATYNLPAALQTSQLSQGGQASAAQQHSVHVPTPQSAQSAGNEAQQPSRASHAAYNVPPQRSESDTDLIVKPPASSPLDGSIRGNSTISVSSLHYADEPSVSSHDDRGTHGKDDIDAAHESSDGGGYQPETNVEHEHAKLTLPPSPNFHPVETSATSKPIGREQEYRNRA